MSKALIGVVLALLFILSESVQTVYLGGVFQRVSAFTFGAIVFGATILVSLGWTAATRPAVLRAAIAKPYPLLGINLCAVITFSAFFLSVQIIEPAITYTISGGVMPLTAWLLERRSGARTSPLELAGTLLLFAAVLFLSGLTITGNSGFVRGGPAIAALGVVLAMADGVFFTLILMFSRRLDAAGVGAFAIMGLRLPLYVLTATALAAAGGDAKPALPAAELTLLMIGGFMLTVPPLYFLQKAVTMISTLTVSALAALGPFVIFALQMIEGRVAYSTGTLGGIALYALASLLLAAGAIYTATRATKQA